MVEAAGLSSSQFQIALLAGICMSSLILLSEWLHLRRIRRIQKLAFGPGAKPAAWTQCVTPLRVLCSGLLVWALLLLAMMKPITRTGNGNDIVSFQKLKHILLVLDVSPSMRLVDAGPERSQSRMARAREVMQSYLRRVPMKEYRVSVVATYTKALPVVVDTADGPVIENILNDLPMHFAFRQGETNLFAGIQEAANVSKGWRPRSTTVVVITDGDTVPATGMPRMPASVSEVLVVGVGDPVNGAFINGKHSRQDVSTLRQVAIRLKGYYHNGNEKHLPTELLRRLTMSSDGDESGGWTLREWAMLAMLSSSICLAALPVLLHHFGTRWQPGIREIQRQGRSDIDRGGSRSHNRPTNTAGVTASGSVTASAASETSTQVSSGTS